MKSLDDPEFSAFVTYSAIVLLKMTLMSSVTAFHRVTRNVFANSEDLALSGLADKDKKTKLDDQVVERSRRCHLNDIENIVPFFALGLLYSLSAGPALSTVVWHYRVFAASRLLHTVVYLNAVPQPSRAIMFFVGLCCNVSMAVQILMNNWNL